MSSLFDDQGLDSDPEYRHRLAQGLRSAAVTVLQAGQEARTTDSGADAFTAQYRPGLAEQMFDDGESPICDMLVEAARSGVVDEFSAIRLFTGMLELRSPAECRSWLTDGVLRKKVDNLFASFDDAELQGIQPHECDLSDQQYDRAADSLLRLCEGAGAPVSDRFAALSAVSPHLRGGAPDAIAGLTAVAHLEGYLLLMDPAEEMVNIVGRAFLRRMEPDQRVGAWRNLHRLALQSVDIIAKSDRVLESWAEPDPEPSGEEPGGP